METEKCTHESLKNLTSGCIDTIDVARCPDCDALFMDGVWHEPVETPDAD